MGNLKSILIPRKTLNARRLTQTLDAYNRPTHTPANFTVENATIHPVSGWEANALPQGYRDRKLFKVFTTTKLIPAEEGSSNSGDLVEIAQDDLTLWCRVVRCQSWQNGVQSHYEAFVVHENER